MNLFDRLASLAFTSSRDDVIAFYPNGKTRSGFRLASVAEREKVQALLAKEYRKFSLYLLFAYMLSIIVPMIVLISTKYCFPNSYEEVFQNLLKYNDKIIALPFGLAGTYCFFRYFRFVRLTVGSAEKIPPIKSSSLRTKGEILKFVLAFLILIALLYFTPRYKNWVQKRALNSTGRSYP